MFTYLLNNGEQYSDYRIVAIVQSEEPLDWPVVKAQIAANMEPVTDDDYWVTTKRVNEALEHLKSMPRVRVLEYEELSFDVRTKLDDDYNVTGEWEIG